ncbi:M14 family metallopeptidase [Shewanella sp. 6_MG-2023]|uniref:M14 family metallopeptidase n=1 Tax=Shewanella sp. 6_MG-2023 TaxID=3062660 RepID=UPI0026E3228E|nr:M14 family metallopeptidase [Shewanella sp. 6_MG-2023]MDO6619627.1 M14 family metallopeptidase [Shewanella sp. 6_MG-2023]
MRRAIIATLVINSFLLLNSNAFATENLSKHSEKIITASPSVNNTFVNDPFLPPIASWQGASKALIQSKNAPWATPFEQNGLISSPNYNDTQQWLTKLVDSSDLLQQVSIGKSPQGRDIWMLVASEEGAATAKELAGNNKPTVLVQAGIHSGEIDGKDAGMMLLRDISHGDKKALLDKVNLLFVPILSVDGHERSDEFNRVNQRGPVNMGWRTNARNLNLNRDYAKLDTLELQHMIRAINLWQPDLYIDVHVTDGIDYQYDVTFGYNVKQGYSPASFDWLENYYRPEVEAALTKQGHVPGGLVFAIDNTDMSKGLSYWNPSPRFSNGYGDARHLPTILIENHSLKPFKQRVLGTYVMLEQTLKTVAEHGTKLTAAIYEDKYRTPQQLALTWQSVKQPQGWDFKGIDYSVEQSDISGTNVVRWNGQPKLYPNLPLMGNTEADIITQRPKFYYVPAQWQQVIERLAIHGVRMTRLEKPKTIKAAQYQFSQPEFNAVDYEGRQRVKASSTKVKITTTLPAGTIQIATNQPLGDLAILLLEPQSADSFFQWGFFNSIFTRTEYIEDYAVEPLAAKMLAEDDNLKLEFEKALEDEAFAADPKARLRWFYQRSPYYDEQYLKYPVLRSH